jgi:serine/threonine-protein kinase
MAEVYLAQDQLLDRPVAVKVLFPELAADTSFVERFRREAQAAARLNHHNIVSVYDFGESDGSYFIVMEYVDGQTLRDVVRSEGPMAPVRAAGIAADVAAALGAAHAQGVVHRDVKPANVLISDEVKVADFGIARAGDPRESLTQTGMVMGTATYLSPEQAQGLPIDRRSDIYSLGVVLYETLAGRPPFIGDTPVAIAYKHLHEEPVPPSEHNPDVSPALDAVVLKAMAKDPADRYGSAEEMGADLAGVATPAAGADPTVAVAPLPGAVATSMMAPVGEPTGIVGAPGATEVVAARPVGPGRDAVYRRRRLVVLGLAAAVLLGLVLLVVLLTRGGGPGTAAVPTVVGQSVVDATSAVEAAGFRASVDEQPGRAGQPGQVVEQRPSGGAQADKGSIVTLVTPAATTSTSSPATSRPSTTRTTASTTTTSKVTTTTTPKVTTTTGGATTTT